MKKYALAIALFIPVYVALVVCCTPTLHPIYTEDDIVFDPELVGVWNHSNADADYTLEITPGEDNAYRLVYIDNEEGLRGGFTAHLVSIGEFLFLDIYPEEPEMEKSDVYISHFIPIHSFARIDSIGPDLQITHIDGDWLATFLDENPDVLAHDIVVDATGYELTLLTAPTEDIQAWLIENSENEQLYDFDPMVFTRVIEDAPEEDE